MLSKLDIIFGKFAGYITGGMFILVCIFGAGWYASNLKLDAQREKVENAEMRLTVSNTSLASLRGELDGINKTLEANHLSEMEQQKGIQEQLNLVNKNDQSRVALEEQLKNRQSTSNCPIPKDLANAWNSL